MAQVALRQITASVGQAVLAVGRLQTGRWLLLQVQGLRGKGITGVQQQHYPLLIMQDTAVAVAGQAVQVALQETVPLEQVGPAQ